MNYIKLVNFELQRFWKLYVVLLSVIAALQIGAAFYRAKEFKAYAAHVMKREQLDADIFVTNYSAFSYSNFFNDSLVELSIMLGFVVIVLYIFFIWYRDWLGKSSFIYRLLMLPSTRIHLFTSKLTTILLLTLGLTGLQVILIPITRFIIEAIVPHTLYEAENIVYIFSDDLLSLFIPHSLIEALFIYSVGIALVTIAFTSILLERSFGVLGILAAIVYSVVTFSVIVMPLFWLHNVSTLYTSELYVCMFCVAVVVCVISTSVSYYLLKTKITV